MDNDDDLVLLLVGGIASLKRSHEHFPPTVLWDRYLSGIVVESADAVKGGGGEMMINAFHELAMEVFSLSLFGCEVGLQSALKRRVGTVPTSFSLCIEI